MCRSKAGPGAELLRGGRVMAVIKVKPTSPGRRAVVKMVHAHLYKGRPEASLLEPQIQNAGRNNNGHITIAPQGRWPQAPLPRRRLRAQQGRHSGEGRAHRVRPEPHRPHRAGVLRRRRAPLHHRPARPGSRRDASLSRRRSADQGRQHAADPQHPGRLDHPLHRDAARQGRADRALGRHVGDAAGARRHLRPGPPALG